MAKKKTKTLSNFERFIQRIDNIGNPHKAVQAFNQEMEKRELDYRMNKSTTQKMIMGHYSDSLLALFLIVTEEYEK